MSPTIVAPWTGASSGPYATADLGVHVGDDPANVAANRDRLAAALAAAVPGVPDDPRSWVWLDQVHGTEIVRVDAAPDEVPTADGAVTSRRLLPLVVMTADCAPIVLLGEGAVGVVHAGWSGLEQGVVEAGVTALRELAPGPVRAVLGPCIHAASYEFGADLLDRLAARYGDPVRGRTTSGGPALDLPGAVAVALRGAGVDELLDVGVDTATSADHFSYRRDGVTGRQATIVVRA